MQKIALFFSTRLFIPVLLTLAMSVSAFAAAIPTDTDYLNMIKRGQNYLFSRQTAAIYNASGVYQSGGYWTDSLSSGHPVAATAFAVAALIDTGVPNTNQHVKDGMAYLRSIAKNVSPTANAADLGKNGIYTDSSHITYENGAALLAFYFNDDPADATLVKNAANLFVARQGTWGSYAGGWDYGMSGNGGDMSNTQFGVMGLRYAEKYLTKYGMSLSSFTWKDNVFAYLQHDQANNGAFGYLPYNYGYYAGGSMTGAGLWSLGLISKHTDTLGNPKGADMKTAAVNWFNSNYMWNGNPGPDYSWDRSYFEYYFVFGMAKALNEVIGSDQKVGTHDWVKGIAGVNGETVNGLRYTMYLQRVAALEGNGDPAIAANQTYWYGGDGYVGDILATSWALMSLGLADATVTTPERVLAPLIVDPVVTPTVEPPPAEGNLVLKATLGVLIEPIKDVHNNPLPFREPIVVSEKVAGSVSPVGAINFQLINVPVGGSVDLRVDVPESTMNHLNAAFDEKKAFVDKHGNPKKNVSWYKLTNGKWRALKGVTIRIDKAASAVIVTLKDGGPADQDGVANGIIVDPGAPGFDTVMATPAGGAYVGAQSVTLTADVPTKAIYYTTNGSEPTTSSTLYSNPITINSNTTLKFFSSDGVPGATVTEVYTIAGSGGTLVAKAINFPVAAPNSATYAVNLTNAAVPTGTVSYTYSFGKVNFVSTAITAITNSGGTYTVTGRGKLNSATGYDFTATLIKGTPASLGFEIRKTVGGTVVFTAAPKAVTNGTVAISP